MYAKKVTQVYIFYLLIKIIGGVGGKTYRRHWRASYNATWKRPSKQTNNIKQKRAAIQPSPHSSGAQLGLKPSHIIHLNTVIVVLIYSSTPLCGTCLGTRWLYAHVPKDVINEEW